MDKDKNTSKKPQLCGANTRCTKPDKCTYLRSQRQQQITQQQQPSCNTKTDQTKTLYRTQGFKPNGSDDEIFHDCMSITDSDFPKEGHSCKGFFSCQSGLSHKPKSAYSGNDKPKAAASGTDIAGCHRPKAAASGTDIAGCHKQKSAATVQDNASCHRAKSATSGQDNVSCHTANGSNSYKDPVVVRAVLSRARKVTDMLMKNFETSNETRDKRACSATLEITARLIPDGKSTTSNAQLQGRPVKVQMPLKFDPNTCQMITCPSTQPRHHEPPPKSTGCPALMYMQDERSHPQINDDAGPSTDSKKIQTEQSYLYQKQSEDNNPNDGNSRTTSNQSLQTDKPIDPAKNQQTNISYLYDTRLHRPYGSSVDQPSQVNLKQDLYAMGNVRYPTQFARTLNDENCAVKCNYEPWSQSKSQPDIPSKTTLQSTAPVACPSTTKSVPNVSLRSELSQPCCNADNATAYYSARSDMVPKNTSNVVFFTVPSYKALGNTIIPSEPQGNINVDNEPQSNINVDNETAYYSVGSEIVTSNQANLEMPSYHTAQSNSIQPGAEPSFNNEQTNYNSVDPSVNPSAGITCMESCETAQTNRSQANDALCALPSTSRYFALNSEPSEINKDKNTVYYSMASAECGGSKAPTNAEQNLGTNWRSACFDACAPNVPIQPSFCPSAQTTQSSKYQNCACTPNPQIQPSFCPSTQTAQSSKYLNCACTPNPQIQPSFCPSTQTAQSSKYLNCASSCEPAPAPVPPPERCCFQDADQSDITTSVKKAPTRAPRCHKIPRAVDADGTSSYYDADKSTIATSVKSCGPYDSDESEEGNMPFNKSSFGCADKTSSRSQSVMAKVTCLCSPEVKAKLGIRSASAEPPFMRVEESELECCIVPADPILVSRTAEDDKPLCTDVVYCCEKYRDCQSSETSIKDKANNDPKTCYCSAVSMSNAKSGNVTHTLPQDEDVEAGPQDQDVEAGQASGYKCAMRRNFAEEKSQVLSVRYRSTETYACQSGSQASAAPLQPAAYKSTTSKYWPMDSLDNESIGVVMECKNPACLHENQPQPEQPAADDMTCDNAECLAEGAREQQQQELTPCCVPVTSYKSCDSDCGGPLTPKERIMGILDSLSDCKAKSQERNANIQQLFRELTVLLREGEKKKDEGEPPLSYTECMEAVAAGQKPSSKAQSNVQTKTTEQKERTECMDQLENYLDKCFPIKKKRPPPPEITAFERDPNFDPHITKPKDSDPDSDGPSKKHDVYFDLPSMSDGLQSAISKSADSKLNSVSPDANLPDPQSEPTDDKSSDSKESKRKSTKSKAGETSAASRRASQASAAGGGRKSTASNARGSKAAAEPSDASKRQSQVSSGKAATPQLTEPELAVETARASALIQSESPKSKEDPCLCEAQQPKAESVCCESKAESEPDNSRAIEKSDCLCATDAAACDEMGPLTDRERMLCEYIMRRMCAMCEEEEQDIEEQTCETCDKSRTHPTEHCLCCHCRALVCDNQCKTVTKTLDSIRYDPVAETKFFIDSIICDMHAMDHVLEKNHIKPKNPKPSPCMGNGPGESFPVTITDVSSLGCRALYVRWQLEDCTAIGGYEIYVDGHLTNRFYNFRHEAGVVANVDVTTGHQIILRAQAVGQEFAGDQRSCGKVSHPHPEMLVGASRPWTPSVFYYEP